MKDNKGITLMSLVVAIVILLLISTITITVGVDVYNMIKVQNFVSKMKVVQTKVDNIAEETDDVSIYGFTKLSDIASTDLETYELFCAIIENPTEYNIDTDKSWNSELDSKIENYYYFSSEDLEKKLGLKNQGVTVIINFKTRNIIAKKGVVKDNKKYYRQYDLSGGDQLINQ